MYSKGPEQKKEIRKQKIKGKAKYRTTRITQYSATMIPYLKLVNFFPMDNHGEFPFKCGFAFLNRWVFIVKKPWISLSPDALAHDYDNLDKHFFCFYCITFGMNYQKIHVSRV
jgi:hypothetical protein